MKRKILAVIMLSLSLCPWTAYGRDGFYDVPKGSEYYQEIEYFSDKGIIQGSGDGLYRPNDNITAVEYLLMLHNTTGYACSLYGCPDYLLKGMLNDFGIRHLTEDKYISKLDVLVQGCGSLGIEPYSARYYVLDHGELFNGLTQREQDVLSLCIRHGVLNPIDETQDSLKGPIARGEAAGLFYALIQLQGISFERPELSEWVDIKFSEEVTDEIWSVVVWNVLAELPDWLVEDFAGCGMKLEVYPFSSEDTEQRVAGRYHFDERITLNSTIKGYTTIYHEFGHHLYFRFVVEDGINDPDGKIVEDLYEAEKENIGRYFREYGKTNQIEFFADAFTWYLDAQLNQTQQKMEQACPMTYAYMDQLINGLGGIDRL